MKRLTGLDASFLALETPTSHVHVASLGIYDPSTVLGQTRSSGGGGLGLFPTGLNVADGVTLTVAPGTIVKSGAAGLGVSGSGVLVAAGTEAAPVVFTSLRDDSAGGDTNNDGSATTPAPGDWLGIVVNGRWTRSTSATRRLPWP